MMRNHHRMARRGVNGGSKANVAQACRHPIRRMCAIAGMGRVGADAWDTQQVKPTLPRAIQPCFGMGERSQRYSMLVKDGVVEQLNIEQGGEFKVSSAEYLLAQL
jgi:hypothetical protein